MTVVPVEQLAADIDQLALSDQLWLLERLAHRIRQRTRTTEGNGESLVAMAEDTAIQQELHMIARDFAVTEMDGLDDRQ